MFLLAVLVQISMFDRALDFKQIVQSLIHLNPLWPTLFDHGDRDPNEAKPHISVGEIIHLSLP